MRLETVLLLAHTLKESMIVEYDLKGKAILATSNFEAVKMSTLNAAYEAGTVDGKNADARKIQEAQVLATSGPYAEAKHAMMEAERAAALAGIECRAVEAQISLTKAWLMSQGN